ncbi:RNA-guided endonuclease InsQ/TnpB family protein [Noviherbaspirillum galbum]|uniref:IS200/IS605 family element transposase accessory protein TnpB n=1 Tax=Noviherbaspirillum galbum TaxID=2709383 RepID=A0A6B3SNU4_9BURK|nr:RNA-guided endonuclease TnpB family protein [Noviherbaspirillum galbum]NEX62417.1 IS200/IS605 family element transposase accessory protein TnpB [Noviherbaspirillum galbum]
MIRSFQYRIKDSSCANHLDGLARAVNFNWNFCNDTQKHALKWGKKWPSGFDLSNLCAGASKELGLHSQTIQAVCETYAARRSEKNRPFLRYRGRRHTGWIPFKASGIKVKSNGFAYGGKLFKVWMSRPLPSHAKIKTGSFSQDAQGHWYISITFSVPDVHAMPVTNEVGIDLGLKEFAAFSNGEKEEANRFYRDLEPELTKSQRANKKRRVKAIHAKIANRRIDYLHKLSTALVRTYGLIVVGNVNASKLAKTKMAKSVMDAGWSSFRDMLKYKAVAHSAFVLEVNEAFTTVTCSACLSHSGPSGLKELRIREWTCEHCGQHHDRDVNSAKNTLRLGHQALAAGIPAP